MPHEYPCRREQTSVDSADGKIDCQATQAANGCPWKRAMDTSDRGMPVLGMFGADCWYRGKVATGMLGRLADASYDDCPGGVEAFYGDGECELSPEFCIAVSNWMKDHVEAYAQLVSDDKEEIQMYRYAAWWIGWVAEAGDGAGAWY